MSPQTTPAKEGSTGDVPARPARGLRALAAMPARAQRDLQGTPGPARLWGGRPRAGLEGLRDRHSCTEAGGREGWALGEHGPWRKARVRKALGWAQGPWLGGSGRSEEGEAQAMGAGPAGAIRATPHPGHLRGLAEAGSL